VASLRKTQQAQAALPRRISCWEGCAPPKLDESADFPMTWLLAATDGPSYLVRIDSARQTTAHVASVEATAQHRIQGPSCEFAGSDSWPQCFARTSRACLCDLVYQQTFPGRSTYWFGDPGHPTVDGDWFGRSRTPSRQSTGTAVRHEIFGPALAANVWRASSDCTAPAASSLSSCRERCR